MLAHDHEHDGPEVPRPVPARSHAPDPAAAARMAASGARGLVTVGGLLALQRSAGNRAVAAALADEDRAAVHDMASSGGGHPLGVAGAGVIQRLKLGGLDTDNKADLGDLMSKISGMTSRSEVEAMRSDIFSQLGSKEPDDNVKQVLRRLSTVEKRLVSEQPTAAVVTTPTLSSAVPAPAPVGRAEPSPATLPERGREQAATLGPGVSPAPAPGPETTSTSTPTTSTTSTTQQDRTAIDWQERKRQRDEKWAREDAERKKRDLEAAAKKRARDEGAAREQAKFAGIQATGKDLKNAAKILLSDRPDEFPESYQSAGFERLAGDWAKALTAEPDWAKDEDTATFVKGVNQTISNVKERKADLEETQQATQEAIQQRQREKEEKAKLLKKKQADSEQEVKGQGEIAGKYVVLRTSATNQEWTRLLLKFLFGKAISRLEQHGDPLVAGLLKHLEDLRKDGKNTYVDLKGKSSGSVQGRAPNSYQVKLKCGLTTMDEEATYDLIISGAKEGELDSLLAKSFVHEAAHAWQTRQYKNWSHPWTKEHTQPISPKWPHKEQQIPIESAPKDVQEAYNEFRTGYENAKKETYPDYRGAAEDYEEVRRAFGAMTKPEYLNTDPYADEQKDMRARELVSHLMEIVYTWNDPEKFKRIFPKCNALLERVIIRGADVGS